MELKGKCKEDFEKWYKKEQYDRLLLGFIELPNAMKWGVYLDFFDWYGLNPYIEKFDDDSYDYTIINKFTTKEIDYGDGTFKTLSEARKAAILTANKIYNETSNN